MSSNLSVFLVLMCLLYAVSQGDVKGPRPFDVSIRTRIHRPPPAESGDPNPPGVTPDPDEIVPIPPFGYRGDRCPWPAGENGAIDYHCVKFIGDQCECIYDDILISQEQCVLNNRTEYEMLAKYQIDLEKENDQKRVEEGMASDADPFYHVLDCLGKIDKIIEDAKADGWEPSEGGEDEDGSEDEVEDEDEGAGTAEGPETPTE